jgi:hypothetical protein
MSQQTDRTLPHLADRPFLEKPPLSYWMSAFAIEVGGDSPAVARVPNLQLRCVRADPAPEDLLQSADRKFIFFG